VLRDVPGVAVSRIGAIGGQTQIPLRGAEANQALVLIDGIEVSDPSTSEFDFGTLLADPAARIEVLRGQQSSFYGSDTISTTSPRPAARHPRYLAARRGGSIGTVDGAAPSNFHVTAVGRYSYSDADINDSDASGVTVDSPGAHYHNRAFYGLLRGQLDLLDGRFTNAVSAHIADTKRYSYDVADTFSPREGQPIEDTFGTHSRRIKGSYEGAFHFGTDDIKQVATVGAIRKARCWQQGWFSTSSSRTCWSGSTMFAPA
jgi:vitamin B12 transporter